MRRLGNGTKIAQRTRRAYSAQSPGFFTKGIPVVAFHFRSPEREQSRVYTSERSRCRLCVCHTATAVRGAPIT